MTHLLSFTDPAATDVVRSGGKGANLARLTQAGFPVPGGVIITPDVYRTFISPALHLVREQGLLRGSAATDRAAAQALSDAMRDAASSLPMPARLAAEIAQLCTESAATNGGARRWAVRSSGTAEDSAAAAFAGQHDTFLNCVGVADVLAHVRACWISLWSPRAIAYRERMGFRHEQVTMAVVIQEMALCDVAGVAFTIDPVTGDLDRMAVDANFGLGESVVAGDGEVDHFIVDKRTGAVIERNIAAKRHRVIATERGTESHDIAEAEALRPSLGDAEIAMLAELLRKVEDHFHWPQDVEWGIVNGSAVLLQSRPVTTIPPRWTRDESAERFPNVVTPLTWDFVQKGFHRSLNHSFRLMGLPEYDGQWFACFGYYVYGNQNAVELYARRSPVRLDQLRSLDALQAQLPALVQRFQWLGTLPERWHRELPCYLTSVQALMDEPLERADLGALWDYVERVDAAGTEYFLPNIAISIGHGLLHRSLRGLLGTVMSADEAEGLTALLVSCETMTTRVNAELRALAMLASSDQAFRARLERGPSRALWQREGATHTEFWRRFGEFLADHGHRETDFDAYHPTWAEAPWVVLDQLRLLVRADAQPQADESARAREQELTERAVLSRVPAGIRSLVSTIVRLAREYTALDDLEHYHTTRLSRPMRRGIRAIGERLARYRVIEEPLDAFFARRETLARAIAQNRPELWRQLGAEVRAAKAAYLGARATSPTWVLDETGPCSVPASDGDLAGIPGSPGTIEGVVHVVNDVDDFAAFPHGAVLVARTTNPAWTPLFYSASAVVTESGGPLSHGAVTAREMRLPAVMSVRGVMHALVNGDRVRVDGTRGTIVRL